VPRRRGAALRRLDDAPSVHRGLAAPLARLPVPARQGQLHRGRYLRDPLEHHRRTGTRAPVRDPGRQGRAVEGPAPMTLLYTDVEDDLRAAVRQVLADRSPWTAVPTPDGLYAVDAADATRTPVTSLDLTRPLCDVGLAGAPARTLAEDATGAWGAALTAGAAILASEQLGVAEWCLESTVDYLKTRYQFGRPARSFQALKHRLAELWVGVTQARAV